MTKKTLGLMVKEARVALELTQRELARAIGVKASHVAYIESGRRRPSLPLLRRISTTLGLNPREMLFLSHPDAKYLAGGIEQPRDLKRPDDSWRRFASNRALLGRHKVTPAELKVLKRVSLLEHVSDPRHFVFVLNAIRQAAVRDDS
ncbi:MAG: helix-turn-helix transcriptional regulator [Candidatus Binataceae bacterium]